MAVIVVVNGSTFYGHKPRRIPRKSVNVEEVSLKLDSSWAGLEVVVYWVNSATGETVRLPLKDPAQPHKIPWEVLADLGELRMGLVGMDGGSTVKPTRRRTATPWRSTWPPTRSCGQTANFIA